MRVRHARGDDFVEVEGDPEFVAFAVREFRGMLAEQDQRVRRAAIAEQLAFDRAIRRVHLARELRRTVQAITAELERA